MPFNMELSNKMNGYILNISIRFNINVRNSFKTILSAVFLSLLTYHNNAFAERRIENIQPYQKLEESKREAAYSLEAARESAVEAMCGARILNDDSLSAEVLLQLGSVLSLQGVKENALRYFEEGLRLSEQIQYEFGHCRALLEIGYIQYTWGEYVLSSTYFEKALLIAQNENFKNEEARALNLLGKYYHTRGFFDKSVEYYNRAIKVNQDLHNNDQAINFYLDIGKTYNSEGDIYMTLSYYLKAYNESEKVSDQMLKADVYNHLGSIYLLLKQPQKSLEYHSRALKIRLTMKEPQATATSYNNIGETYLQVPNYDSAMVNFNRSYDLCLQTSYMKGTIKALTNLGRTENKTNNIDSAYLHLNHALELAINSGYNAGAVESSLTLGHNFLLRKKYAQAIDYFEKSLSKMNSANSNEFQPEAFYGLYKCYKELGNDHEALYYHEKYTLADHTALMAENDRQLAELRVHFDLQKKENDNEKLRQENELKQLALTKRNWVIWSVVVMLLFTIALCWLIYFRYVQKRKSNSQLQKVVKELELANVEKDKMFSIIAHELRNPLFWFKNLSEVLSKNYKNMSEEKLQKSLQSIDDSAKNAFHLMDNLLNWSRTRLNRINPKKAKYQLLALVEECVHMFDTILEQKAIHLNINIPDKMTIYTDADMFSCILRNLVSNAIKYTPVNKSIKIEAETVEDFCLIKVCDSGIGVSQQQVSMLFNEKNFSSKPGLMQEKGSGLGLKLCKEFTNLSGGEIWSDFEDGWGTCFYFTMPVE